MHDSWPRLQIKVGLVLRHRSLRVLLYTRDEIIFAESSHLVTCPLKMPCRACAHSVLNSFLRQVIGVDLSIASSLREFRIQLRTSSHVKKFGTAAPRAIAAQAEANLPVVASGSQADDSDALQEPCVSTRAAERRAKAAERKSNAASKDPSRSNKPPHPISHRVRLSRWKKKMYAQAEVDDEAAPQSMTHEGRLEVWKAGNQRTAYTDKTTDAISAPRQGDSTRGMRLGAPGTNSKEVFTAARSDRLLTYTASALPQGDNTGEMRSDRHGVNSKKASTKSSHAAAHSKSLVDLLSTARRDPGSKPPRNEFSIRMAKDKEPWQVQKAALAAKVGEEGWNPRRKLSPDAMEGIRALHAQYPERFSTPVLAQQFKLSPEAIRRILKSKWRPSEEEAEERNERWERRGARIWSKLVEEGEHAPKKWREMGIGAGGPRKGRMEWLRGVRERDAAEGRDGPPDVATRESQGRSRGVDGGKRPPIIAMRAGSSGAMARAQLDSGSFASRIA